MDNKKKILIQCDFDGTITLEDASFAILDTYIPGNYEKLFEEYQDGDMTLGDFNSCVFSMVKADKQTLLSLVDHEIHIRNGFREFMEYCRKNKYEIIIVSNGLDFYIEHILAKAGFPDIEYHASITSFETDGLSLRHKGPDGDFLDNDVKAAFTDSFLGKGYTVVYLGDGRSDLLPASKCSHVFATGPLIGYCGKENLNCTPFTDFFDVIREMKSWK